MERHALLHHIQHRRQLSRRMTARPSLLTYVTGHNLLPNTLNPQNSAPAKQKDDGRPQGSPPPTTVMQEDGRPQGSLPPTTWMGNDGRPQGSPPPTTPPPPLLYDAPSANLRFAGEDSTGDEAEADIVGAGVAEDVGRGPLWSPVEFQTEDGESDPLWSPVEFQTEDGESDPLWSPVVAPVNDAKHAPSRSPIVAPTEDAGHAPSRSSVIPQNHDGTRSQHSHLSVVSQTHDGAGHEPSRSSVVAQNNDVENKGRRPQQPDLPSTTVGNDGRPQGSPPPTTPPPPLPYDEPPANLRFAAHNTASDEGGADIVGAGAADVVGRGPLWSPVESPSTDVGRGPLRSPDVFSTDDVGRGPLRLPVVAQNHDEAGDAPLRSPVVAPTDNGAAHEPSRSPVLPTIQHARPRRGRIEERPASTMSTNPTIPTAQGPQPNTQTPHKPEIAGRPKGTGQPGKTGKQEQPKTQAQIEADALFQSNGESANRTPQQWLAMLMKAERGEPSKPESSPKPATRDEAPEYSRGEGGGDDGRGTLAVARSSQHNEDEGRGTLAVARRSQHNEDDGRGTHAAVNPTQNDENAPAKHLPVVRPLSRTTTQPENAQAEPLSQQTRQFLRPLVGYDPANARVHRGVPAARFAASHNAQAVTSGDDITLAAGHQSDTPETLGLLAHELTHVARQHTPGFVPPVANNNVPVGAQFIAPSSPPLLTTNPRTDEEGVAEQVEQQTIRRARGQAKQTGNSSQWGGLPAPWEPLPDWLASSPTTAETRGRGNDIDGHRATQPATMDSRSVNMSSTSNGNSHTAHTTTASAGTRTVASNGNGGNSGNSANGSVQRAGNERSMNIAAQEVNEPSRGQQQNNSMQEPEPDLDELARQVYTVLKRRLGVERRRMG